MNLFRRKVHHVNEIGDTDAYSARDAIARTRIKVIGTVLRIRKKPADGLPALIVTIGDDDGRVQAHWSGRNSLPGIALGARIIIEGVASPTSSGLVFLNPLFEIVNVH
jgi:hypothetical protein